MGKSTTKREKSSRVTYDVLEGMARLKIQEFIQDILNEECKTSSIFPYQRQLKFPKRS